MNGPLVAIACLAFGLSYAVSYRRWVGRSARSTRRLWLVLLIVGIASGALVGVALLSISFLIFAAIVGPPLQSNAWSTFERIIPAVVFIELAGVGWVTGTATAKALNQLSYSEQPKR
ncbi:MAG: hypothetical protein AAFR42_16415 [Cyanobacteria bacterium J06628_6]